MANGVIGSSLHPIERDRSPLICRVQQAECIRLPARSPACLPKLSVPHWNRLEKGSTVAVTLEILAAHFAEAIDLPTLKRHHDGIRDGLADIEHRFAQNDEPHTRGRAFLHDSLRLLTDARNAYMPSGDGDRRIANHALYTRLEFTDDWERRPTLGDPLPRSSARRPEARKPNGNTHIFRCRELPQDAWGGRNGALREQATTG